jgi:tetratricopeptide (TPR) repeat protein
MKSEGIVLLASGSLFGLIAGWVLGSQPSGGSAPPRAVVAQPENAGSVDGATPPPLDETRVQDLIAAANGDPSDALARTTLGNLYFDAERFREAITWYEASLVLDPQNVNASTDLGVSYYYTNQPDRALAQFAHSLGVEPEHVKTMLNIGVVRAFGMQDLAGAAEVWERVIAIAPESPEGLAAQQALERLRSAHAADVDTTGA